MRINFIYKSIAGTVCAAVMIAASMVSVAQPLPFGLITPDRNDPVQLRMLSGEASAVSQYLGISTDQLRTELTGHSLADVAQMHGQSEDAITGVVVAAANSQLDAAVGAGDLSTGTANQYRAEIALFAPMLVRSADASAMALQYANS